MFNHKKGSIAAADTNQSLPNPQAPSKSPRNRVIVIASAAILLVIAASLAAYFVVKNKSSPSSDSTLPVATPTNATTATGNNSTTTPAIRKPKLIGYWGQNAAGNGILDPTHPTQPLETQMKNLGYYCDLGIYSTINLAFMTEFGGGDDHFTINFSKQAYYLYPAGGPAPDSAITGFGPIAKDIKHCQALGIKVILSLGGDKISNYKFGPGDGKTIGTWLYNRFLEGTDKVRPFGDVVLDGIELDVEKGEPSWNQEMIDLLTTIRALSPKTTLAIVPECYIYDREIDGQNLGYYLYTGRVIANTSSIIDYIIIQYYNNNICSYPYGFNYKDWKKLYKGPMVVGLAGDWTSAISGGFLELPDLQAVSDMVLPDEQFMGFSLYDISSSSPPYSSYSSNVHSVLNGTIVAKANPPQGVYRQETEMAMRCGKTWHTANLACGRSCKTDGDCGGGEGCFKWLVSC
ncbi:UNVERIFIED_CONTAM: Chitinase 2 [Siphonaria sp. JEL0065]|nr:Chitinase 2 [Siphonaria sp. JEL0065]